MTYFSIVGDHFPLNTVTEKLEIEPTQTYCKGDIIEGSCYSSHIRTRIETDWTLSTDYEESFDINNQLNILLKSLKEKNDELKSLKENYSLSFLFVILIELYSEQKPAIYLEQEILSFAASIQADIEIDLSILY